MPSSCATCTNVASVLKSCGTREQGDILGCIYCYGCRIVNVPICTLLSTFVKLICKKIADLDIVIYIYVISNNHNLLPALQGRLHCFVFRKMLFKF